LVVGALVAVAGVLGAATRTQVLRLLLKTKPLGHGLQIGALLTHVTKIFGFCALSWKSEPSGWELQSEVGPIKRRKEMLHKD